MIDRTVPRRPFFEVLTEIQVLLGKDNPKIVNPIKNLGHIFQSQGNFNEALEQFERSLSINEGIFGKNHPKVAFDNYDIGILYKDSGNQVKAREKLMVSFEICKKFLGDENPSTLEVKKALDELENLS